MGLHIHTHTNTSIRTVPLYLYLYLIRSPVRVCEGPRSSRSIRASGAPLGASKPRGIGNKRLDLDPSGRPDTRMIFLLHKIWNYLELSHESDSFIAEEGEEVPKLNGAKTV